MKKAAEAIEERVVTLATTYDGRYGVDNTHASAEDRRPTGFGV